MCNNEDKKHTEEMNKRWADICFGVSISLGLTTFTGLILDEDIFAKHMYGYVFITSASVFFYIISLLYACNKVKYVYNILKIARCIFGLLISLLVFFIIISAVI